MTEQPTPRRIPIQTIKVYAREEDFRIVQLQGNLFVCSKAHGNCCCGWEAKGRAPVNTELYGQEWERRKLRNQIHLSFTGCLGPCATGNNVLLQIFGESIWLKDLNDDRFIPLIFDYIQAMVAEGRALPPPDTLRDHVFARYLPPPERGTPIVEQPERDTEGLDRLDPVCLMDVDPSTAKWQSSYGGRTYSFCAPGCKKQFDRDPAAYVTELGV